MGIFDLFSKRSKRARGEFPDVYQYQDIPQALRVQMWPHLEIHVSRIRVWTLRKRLFEQFNNTLCREYGLFSLNEERGAEFDKGGELHAL